MPARGNILSPSCWSQVGPMWGQFGGVRSLSTWTFVLVSARDYLTVSIFPRSRLVLFRVHVPYSTHGWLAS